MITCFRSKLLSRWTNLGGRRLARNAVKLSFGFGGIKFGMINNIAILFEKCNIILEKFDYFVFITIFFLTA